MLNALTLLIGLQLAGEVLARLADVPLPGPVIGLLLLLAGLVLARRLGHAAPGPQLKSTAQALLLNLSLLFVPAGVGVITQLDLLGRNWIPVSAAILISTPIGLIVTALTMNALTRRDPA